MSAKPRYRILTRPVESWELKPILERMPKGTVLKLCASPTVQTVQNARKVIYSNNSYHGRILYWKTHWRPEGFFIERWR